MHLKEIGYDSFARMDDTQRIFNNLADYINQNYLAGEEEVSYRVTGFQLFGVAVGLIFWFGLLGGNSSSRRLTWFGLVCWM